MTTEMTKRETQNLVNRDPAAKSRSQSITPPVDVLENQDEFLLIADLPGVPTNAVSIELRDGELTLHAPITASGVNLFTGGRTDYAYARRFRVPAGVDSEKIRAELAQGVLKLYIPKAEARKPRQIPVSG